MNPLAVNVDEPALVIRMSPDRLVVAPVFVTEAVKVIGSPGTMKVVSASSVADIVGRTNVLITSVTVIDAHVFAPAVHVPDWHVSGPVQLLPSLHDVPFDASTSAGHEAEPPVQVSGMSH